MAVGLDAVRYHRARAGQAELPGRTLGDTIAA